MSLANPTVTVSSGYYNNTMPTSYHRDSTEFRLIRTLKPRGNRHYAKVMRALNGVAPGAAVSDTYVRITQPAAFGISGFGGNRTVETVTTADVGTVTTAAQRDYLNTNVYDRIINSMAPTYPRDLSGNGGGGKVQK